MTATTLPNVGIQYKWALAEDGWNTGMDSNLLAADSLIQCSVISAAVTTPPVSPSEGDRYIPYTGATGAWSSLVGKLVVYANAAWVSYTPKEGWLVYDNNTNGYLKYDGAAWVADALGDRAYADSVSSVNIATTITRGHKFGNHVYLSATVPNCPYLGYGSGSQPTQYVESVEALTNRGNIADSLLWEMSSNTIDTNTGVSLFTYVTSAIYPQQRWVTGAKMQFLASLALATVIPTTENFVYRIGLSNVAASDISALNPFAGRSSLAGSEYTGCAAFFQADNTTGYWQCKSGQKASTQTTTTSVPYVLGQFAVFHVVVTTTGAVEFRINGTLVATHSGAGVIPNGAWLSESVGIRNLAATTTANKGFHLDEFQFRLTLPSARTGFAFS